MGLDDKGAQFLLAARRLGVSFERTATIGRQQLYVTPPLLRRRLGAFGIATTAEDTRRLFDEDGFAEPLLRLLGARQTVSIDASAYEGASRILDLNQPLPPDLEGAFTAVVDAGSLEHVFDVRTAMRNCMRMVAPDGYFLAITPANNMMGHGFYQFSPELFYRVFSEANGFTVERMLLTSTSSTHWFEVADPKAIGARVQLSGFRPTYLCVAARRGRDAVGPRHAAAAERLCHTVGGREGHGGISPRTGHDVGAEPDRTSCAIPADDGSEEPLPPAAGDLPAVRSPCVPPRRHRQAHAARTTFQ